MSNTIKIGTNNINAIKLGSVDVDAVYLGTNLVYTSTPPTPQSSCYEIVPIPITSYTSTTYDSVYSASDEKWYMKNNLNQYEEYGIYETGTSLSDFTYYDGKLTAIGTTEYQWDGSQWQNVGVYESSETTWTIDNHMHKYEGETLLTSFKIPIEDISEIGYLDFSIIVSGGRLMINSDEYTYENNDSGDYEEGTITDDGTYLNYSLPTTKEVVVDRIEYWDSTPIHLIMEVKEISVEYSAKTVSTNVYQSVAEMEAVGCPTVGVGQYGFVGNDIYKYTNNEEWIGTSLQDPKMVAFYSSGTPLVVYNNSDTTLSSIETKASTLPIEVYVGNSVTTIGNEAFIGCKSISACTIGSGVTTIGTSAFRDCSGLTSIVIPSSVTTISDTAFLYCSGLTTCTISNGVTSIGGSAFGSCSQLASIEIPNSVISINSFAFDNTPWWNSYSVDTSHQYGNIIYINDVAYKATSTGITSCTFKEGSISIGGGAFMGCKSLTSVNIPNSVTLIGNGAFNNCSGLTNVTIGSGVTTIGDSAFYQCKKLTSVNIPNSVTSIGDGAFNVCSGLTTCTIGSGVTSIGSNAFANCKRLTSIEIPNSVTTIGNYAFNNCSGLTLVTVNATEPPTLGTTVFDNTNDCPIYVPCESVENYKTAWSDYASRIDCVPPTPTAQTPCYAVVDNISQYSSTDFEDVFNNADEKWYKLNNLTQYEEYGIYASGRTECGSTPSRLPSGYTEVEYIENTGTSTSNGAYINTGVLLYDNANNTFTITSRLKSQYYAASGDNTLQTIINSEGVSSPYNGFTYRYKYNTSGQQLELAGNNKNASLTTVDNEDGTRTITIQTVSAATFTEQVPLSIFSSFNGNYSTPYRFSKTTLYSMTVVKNGTTIRDFVPAQRDSDSKYGLYDLITSTFYVSPNGNNFVGGSAVTPSQECVTTYDGKLTIDDDYEYQYSGGTWNNVGEISGGTEYPMYYPIKQDPPTSVTFATMEEALQYQCPYVGLHATIGGEGYIFNEQYQWETSLDDNS